MSSVLPFPSIERPDAPGRINPDLYIDRELSYIALDQRVLEEAQDVRNPLLERVNFLSIFDSILDEFFMIRVSGVKEQIQAGINHRAPSGLTPLEQHRAIRAALLPLIAECQRLLHDELLPTLRDQGIYVLHAAELNETQRAAMQEYYEREMFPVLTPLAIDASHPFPFISNLNISLIVVIADKHDGPLYARVKVPEGYPRLVPLPPDAARPEVTSFVWLEDVIAANLADLFPGKTVLETFTFTVTRDTDLTIQEDEASDLLETIEEGVRRRPFGSEVRLTVEARTSPAVREFLVQHLELTALDVYDVDGPLHLASLAELTHLDRPDLKYPAFVPGVPVPLRDGGDIFAAIREHSIILHHPFDSFTPIIDLVRTAAHDPQVLAIKQTLYRVGQNSPIVAALMEAREAGKQVATLVELKARFDEENNIEWAQKLEKAGVHVVFGLNGLKTHAKLLIIVRKEDDGLRRYVHLGTGNYNATTAHGYTDIGLLTCDEAIGADVTELFNVLTGYSDQVEYRKLSVAPHGLRTMLLSKIARETERHREFGDGYVLLKFNALTDEQMIIALYQAARAGVRIDLIVRGMCCLRPGIAGLSETVTVRSIIGRFLEHSRLYYFYNGGSEELFLGSADLMDRNLDRRVETLFPIESTRLLRYLRDTVLETYLNDNTQARELQSDGSYIRLQPGDAPAVDAQRILLEASAQVATP